MSEETDDFGPDSEWWKNMQRQREKEKQAAAAKLKAACAPLAKLGVVTVTWTYDGYGDSGDVESEAFATAQGAVFEELAPAALEKLTAEERELLTAHVLRDAVLELLPDGFEINDGSYGQVTLDVTTGKIMIGHNARYTESTYSEEEL